MRGFHKDVTLGENAKVLKWNLPKSKSILSNMYGEI